MHSNFLALQKSMLTLFPEAAQAAVFADFSQYLLAEYKAWLQPRLQVLLATETAFQVGARAFFTEHWQLVQGSLLAPTALNSEDLLLFLTDMACCLAESSAENALSILFPGMGLESQRDGFPDLKAANAETVLKILRTHVLADDGKTLIPVRMLLDEDYLDAGFKHSGKKLYNPYSTSYDFISAGELQRLRSVSTQTEAFCRALEDYAQSLQSDTSNLLSQLNLLRQRLRADDAFHGQGSEEVAGENVACSIIQFFEFYDKLNAAAKASLPEGLVLALDKLSRVASEQDGKDNYPSCIASRREEIEAAMYGQERLLLSIRLGSSEQLANQQQTLAAKSFVLENFKRAMETGSLGSASDKLGLTEKIITALNLQMPLVKRQDLRLILSMSAKDMAFLFTSRPYLAGLVSKKIEYFEEFLLLSHEISAEKLQILLQHCHGYISHDYLKRDTDLSHLLASHEDEDKLYLLAFYLGKGSLFFKAEILDERKIQIIMFAQALQLMQGLNYSLLMDCRAYFTQLANNFTAHSRVWAELSDPVQQIFIKQLLLIYAIINQNEAYIQQNWAEALRDAHFFKICIVLFSCRPSASITKFFEDYRQSRSYSLKDLPERATLMFITAAAHGQLELMRLCLRLSANPSAYVLSNTALLIAVKFSQFAVFEYILGELLPSNQAQASVLLDQQDPFGKTALIYAVEAGNLRVVSLLLDRGASVHIKDKCETNALMLAASAGSLEICKQIIAANERSGDERKIEQLIDDSDGYEQTALMYAVLAGREAVALYLIEKGAIVDLVDSEGETPLLMATAAGNFAMVKLLVESGAQLELKNDADDTALIVAIESGQLSIALYLLDKGADIASSFFDLLELVLISKNQDYYDTIIDLSQKAADDSYCAPKALLQVLIESAELVILVQLLERGLISKQYLAEQISNTLQPAVVKLLEYYCGLEPERLQEPKVKRQKLEASPSFFSSEEESPQLVPSSEAFAKLH